MSHLQEDHIQDYSSVYDYLIIGAGPAGLQLGHHLAKAGRSYLILESGEGAGTFYTIHPRHRQLISINKVFTGYDDPEINLRWDWNSLLSDSEEMLFKNYTKDYFPDADLMVDYLRDYAKHYDLAIRYKTRVVNVERDDIFTVTDSDDNGYRGKRLIVATGVSLPYMPPIPGIELTENYCDVSVDADEFANQRVLVLGKGNSAFETADHLIPRAALIHVASPNPVKLAWKTHHVGHLRAVNNNFLDTYQLKSQNAVLDCDVQRIERRGDEYVVAVKYTHADEEAEALIYDRVICCTGFRFDGSIFGGGCQPELKINDRFPALTSAWESVNIPDLYFAGTVMQVRDFKKYTSGFIHGFRYNVRSLHRIMEERYHAVDWPERQISASVDGLTQAVIDRVNSTSGLWQQFSFLCDVFVIDEGSESARYYEELPVDYVRETDLGQSADYFTLNLEFGKSQEDPFHVQRHPDPSRAEDSFFLHPVIRHYHGSELVGEHHLLEDLAAEWKHPKAHIEPLAKFFAEQRQSRPEPAQPVAAAMTV